MPFHADFHIIQISAKHTVKSENYIENAKVDSCIVYYKSCIIHGFNIQIS